MNRSDASPPHPSRHVPHGLAPSARKWPVGVVLVVALALALAVPLAGRAFGTAAPNHITAPK